MPVEHLQISTRQRREIIDITARVADAVAAAGIRDGLVCVSVPHCTCTVYVNENESGLVSDTLKLLSQITGTTGWQHDRIDDNAAAHLAASLVGNAVLLPVSGGKVELGTWQRIMLAELDGPRNRRVTVTVVGA